MPPLTRSKTLNDRLNLRTAQNNGRLKLPGLPAELKLMIYEHLLPSKIYVVLLGPGPRGHLRYQAELSVHPFWKKEQDNPGQLYWLLDLLYTCRTLRDDLMPLVHQSLHLDMRPCDCPSCLTTPNVFSQKARLLSICSSLETQLPLDNNNNQKHIKALAVELGHLSQLRQLTLSDCESQTINGGRTWSMTKQSVMALRMFTRTVPWLSKILLDPKGCGLSNAYPAKNMWAMGAVRFTLPGTTSDKDEYEIDIEQEASISKDHIRALRYHDMRGLSTEYVQGTRFPQQRGAPGTLQPQDILEAAGAIRKTRDETSKIASVATDFSEADLLRLSLVGLFLMGPLRHIVNQPGVEHT